MDYSQTETPYIRQENRSLTQDIKQSILWHGGVICLVGLYVLLADLTMMFYHPVHTNIDHQTIIGVEFIGPESIKSPDALVVEQAKIQTIQSPESRMPTPEKSVVINEPKQEVLPQKRQPVKAAIRQEKKPPTQVQRQASQLASITKTSTARKINIRRSAGAKSSTQAVGNMHANTKKETSTHGVLSKANAQVLAAKKTLSSAPKIVQNSTVKKTAESLTKVATTPKAGSRTQAESVVKKSAKSAQVPIQQSAVKKRQAALRRAEQLAEDKRRAALAAEQKKHRDHMIMQTIQQYGQMITDKIQQVALFNPGMGGLKSQLKIQLKADGHVHSVSLRESSGNSSFDRLAINAVYKAAPLPLPDDQEISQLMTQINLTIRPDIHTPLSE